MLDRPRAVSEKTTTEIVREWDQLAAHRAEQIETRSDLSFHFVLLPSILELVRTSDTSRILDAGCGTGFVAGALSPFSRDIVGVDPSGASIKIAGERFGEPGHVQSQATCNL